MCLQKGKTLYTKIARFVKYVHTAFKCEWRGLFRIDGITAVKMTGNPFFSVRLGREISDFSLKTIIK